MTWLISLLQDVVRNWYARNPQIVETEDQLVELATTCSKYFINGKIVTVKFLNFAVISLEVQIKRSFDRKNCADRMTNSVDRDQTAPLGTVSSGSALFAKLVCPKTYDHYSIPYKY